MSTFIGRSNEIPSMYEELVQDRIRTLHREAEEQRRVTHILRARRARRDAERASTRLRHALMRLV
ncbi:hypothetical protein Misp01_27260 [Microtetraspora sp. NBRC 13810]|uniref:hypothetical protein n=1 Tax=Microtetraspora sp. NBRC 13810 TaxID=3030990 RepID=UPI0024A079A6|nr:hypothetical protein [Microtetraspora sp. NBRC 13810]GLW07596.1 hypothetical protein Misp01_27260 [Microtetraspora sp. NBRC 13810]